MAIEYVISAVDNASAVFDGVEKKLASVGDKMQSSGKKLTTAVTLPILGAATASGAASIGFESAFTGVIKTVDASEEELASLREGILEMAKELPQSASAIAGVAEAAGQLGIDTQNILSFSRTMIDLGETTNMSSDEAATALARLANITQMPQTDFDRLGSTIVALGNNLATTEAEIVEMGLRLAGAGSTVGLTEAQILGFAGALSSVGIEAEAGGSAVSKLMVNIASEVATGGKNLEKFAQVAGMSSAEFSEAFQTDAGGAIISFIEGLGRMQASGENVFGVLEDLGLSEIRLRDALLRASNAGDLFRESLALGSEAWAENSALTKEAELRYGTTASQLSVLWNRITDVAITVGDVLIPVFMQLLEQAEPLFAFIASAAERFAELDPKLQMIILGALGIAAAIGPLLVVLGMLVPGIEAVGTVISFLASPIGLIIAAIAALAAVFVYLWTTNETFRDIVIGVWEHVKSVAIAIFDGLKAFWDEWGADIIGFFTTTWDAISGIFDAVFGVIFDLIMLVFDEISAFWDEWGDTIIEAFNNVFEILSIIFSTVFDTIMTVIKSIFEGIQAFWDTWGDTILSAFETVFGILKSIFEGTWNVIKTTVETVIGVISGVIDLFLSVLKGDWKEAWESIKGVIQSVWDGIAGIIKAVANTIIGIVNGIIGAVEKMVNFIGSAINKIPKFKVPDWVPLIGGSEFGLPTIPTVSLPKVPKLEVGTDLVMDDGLAMLHAGEAVVPAAEVAKGGFSGRGDRGKGTPIVINVSAADFTDPEHVRKLAQLLGDEFARQVGGVRA